MDYIRKCFAVFNSNHRPDSTGNCQHQPPNSSTDSVHVNSSVFTIKNENKMQFNSREHQFDSRRVAINSESSANAATSTEDEDERSSPQQNSSILSSNQDEPNKHYSSLSSTCSSGKFRK
ncbi:hypothetical protein GJ496_000444 [Pomphorhynchus laevis]|nr:hypothetical protein GJ496_000444 [Pomphorhynchus laevis]